MSWWCACAPYTHSRSCLLAGARGRGARSTCPSRTPNKPSQGKRSQFVGQGSWKSYSSERARRHQPLAKQQPFLLSFLPSSFLASLLPSLLPSFLASFLPSFLPSFLQLTMTTTPSCTADNNELNENEMKQQVKSSQLSQLREMLMAMPNAWMGVSGWRKSSAKMSLACRRPNCSVMVSDAVEFGPVCWISWKFFTEALVMRPPNDKRYLGRRGAARQATNERSDGRTDG